MPTQLSYEDEEIGDFNLNLSSDHHLHRFEDNGLIYEVDIRDELLSDQPGLSHTVLVANPPLHRLNIVGIVQIETTENNIQMLTLEPESHLTVYCQNRGLNKTPVIAFTVINSKTILS